MFSVAAGDVVAVFLAEVAGVEDVVNDGTVFTVVEKLKLMGFLETSGRYI